MKKILSLLFVFLAAAPSFANDAVEVIANEAFKSGKMEPTIIDLSRWVKIPGLKETVMYFDKTTVHKDIDRIVGTQDGLPIQYRMWTRIVDDGKMTPPFEMIVRCWERVPPEMGAETIQRFFCRSADALSTVTPQMEAQRLAEQQKINDDAAIKQINAKVKAYDRNQLFYGVSQLVPSLIRH